MWIPSGLVHIVSTLPSLWRSSSRKKRPPRLSASFSGMSFFVVPSPVSTTIQSTLSAWRADATLRDSSQGSESGSRALVAFPSVNRMMCTSPSGWRRV